MTALPKYRHKMTADNEFAPVLDSTCSKRKVTRLSCGEPFRVLNLYKDMEFEGIDILFLNNDLVLGRLRYKDGEMKYHMPNERGSVRPTEDTKWLTVNTDIKKYVDKRMEEGNVLPMIEEDPKRVDVIRQIIQSVERFHNFPKNSFSKGLPALNRLIQLIVEEEIKIC